MGNNSKSWKFPLGDAFDGGIIFKLELRLKELKPSTIIPYLPIVGIPKFCMDGYCMGCIHFSQFQWFNTNHPIPLAQS
jgi:hypothetical protein